MEEYNWSTYGDRIAEAYDERFARRLDTTAAVEAIADLATAAGATRAPELAIGTGRIALPLKERGFDIRGVHGRQQQSRLDLREAAGLSWTNARAPRAGARSDRGLRVRSAGGRSPRR